MTSPIRHPGESRDLPQEAPRPKRRAIPAFAGITSWAAGLIVPLTLLLLWELQSRRGGGHSYAFVPLEAIGASFVALLQSGELVANMLASLRRAVTGLLLGGMAGIALGAAMASSALVDRIVGPVYHSVRQVPLLGWLPLIGLWLGNGDGSKLLIVSLAAFYPTVLNSYEGLKNVEARYLEVGRVLGFNRWQLFEHIALPAALPFIVTGLFQALAFAWISTIGTEILFGSGSGLGTLMQHAQAASRLDVVIVCVAGVGLMGFLMNSGFARVGRHVLRWQSVRA